MKCPHCGSEAYVGFTVVECTNSECRCFVRKPEPIELTILVAYRTHVRLTGKILEEIRKMKSGASAFEIAQELFARLDINKQGAARSIIMFTSKTTGCHEVMWTEIYDKLNIIHAGGAYPLLNSVWAYVDGKLVQMRSYAQD